jgi:hypothetical protein
MTATKITALDRHGTAGPAADGGSFNFLRAWERFWFSPADPTTLGFMRIVGGLVLLYVTFTYSYDLMSYVHPDQAWLSAPAANFLRYEAPIRVAGPGWNEEPMEVGHGSFTWSVFYHLHDPAAMWAVHIGILVSMLLFTLGLWSRLTAVLSWAGALAYIHRSPITLFGMDAMIVIFMSYMVIAPSGGALSLDRWLELRRERRRRNLPNLWLPPLPSVSANLATRLFQVHFCFIYAASGASKLLGPAWWNGTALWSCLANYSFAPMSVGLYNSFLVWLCNHRVLWELLLSGGAVFTLFLEIGLPFLVWLPRWRWLMVCGAVLMHTGIGLSMGLVCFGLVMVVLATSFVPPEVVRRALQDTGARLRRLWTRWSPRPAAARPAEELALSQAR